jgi:hypothetical protein
VNVPVPTSGYEHYLGPFPVLVHAPAENAPAKAVISFSSREGVAVLYMETVPLNQTGTYTLAVQSPPDSAKNAGNIPLPDTASVKVTVSGTSTPCWSPWAVPVKPRQPADAPWTADAVANPADGIALPAYDGKRGIALEGLPDPKLPLPQLIPGTPDPGVRVDISGNRLIVKLTTPVSVMYLSQNFLTRWWVNGAPFIPKSAPLHVMSCIWDGQVPRVMEFHLDLEFLPGRLGVKKGDNVGLQLLICPDGWESCGPDHAVTEAVVAPDEAKAGDIYISRMSNRLEFTYSGDPGNFAEKRASTSAKK